MPGMTQRIVAKYLPAASHIGWLETVMNSRPLWLSRHNNTYSSRVLLKPNSARWMGKAVQQSLGTCRTFWCRMRMGKSRMLNAIITGFQVV